MALPPAEAQIGSDVSGEHVRGCVYHPVTVPAPDLHSRCVNMTGGLVLCLKSCVTAAAEPLVVLLAFQSRTPLTGSRGDEVVPSGVDRILFLVLELDECRGWCGRAKRTSGTTRGRSKGKAYLGFGPYPEPWSACNTLMYSPGVTYLTEISPLSESEVVKPIDRVRYHGTIPCSSKRGSEKCLKWESDGIQSRLQSVPLDLEPLEDSWGWQGCRGGIGGYKSPGYVKGGHRTTQLPLVGYAMSLQAMFSPLSAHHAGSRGKRGHHERVRFNEHRVGGVGQSGAGVEGGQCQVAEAWGVNLTDDITNALESPFENALRAGTAQSTSLDSRASDLDERMAKVAHLHVEDPGGRFGPGVT